jgi:hypothetical protein
MIFNFDIDITILFLTAIPVLPSDSKSRHPNKSGRTDSRRGTTGQYYTKA